MDEEINYRTLRKIQEMEKNSPSLTEITPGFYNSVSEYLKNLEERYQKETNSQKQMMIQDELNNIKKIALNIYEHREKKILLTAISKTRGASPDLTNLNNEEKQLFDQILTILLQTRENIFKNEKKIEKEEKHENKVEENIEPKKIVEAEEKSRSVVMIDMDIPEFIGTDTKKYNLRKGDIITVPEEMSDMLVKRNAAKKIDL